MKFEKITPAQNKLLHIILIVGAVFIVFGNTINHDYNLDDSYYIELLPKDDATAKDYVGLFKKRFFKDSYRPIPTIHLALENLIANWNPKVFHAFNIIYYCLLGIVLYLFFGQLKIFDDSKWLLLFVLFFVLHASHANVVASIKNRESILAMLYGLSASWILLKAVDEKRYVFLPLALVCFLFAGLSKLDGFLFMPFALLVIYVTREIKLKHAAIGGFCLIAIVALTYIATNKWLAAPVEAVAVTSIYENPYASTEGLLNQWLLGFAFIWQYLKFMIVPADYFFYFGFDEISAPNVTLQWLTLVFYFILILFLAYITLLKKWMPHLLGLAIGVLFIHPVIASVHSTAGIVAVRYSFNASLGFCLLAMSGLYFLSKRKRVMQEAVLAIAIALPIVFGYKAFDRSRDWKDKETLFQHDIKLLKKSYMANRMAGTYDLFLANKSDNSKRKGALLNRAEKQLNRARTIYENDPSLYHQFGELYAEKKAYKKAYFSYKKAIELDSSNVKSWLYYGNFAEFGQEFEIAQHAYEQIIALNPENALPYRNITFLFVKQNNLESAKNFNLTLIQQNTYPQFGYENLGRLSLMEKDTLNAIMYLDKAFQSGLINDGLKQELKNLKTSNP